MYRIHEGPIDADAILRWGYDDNLYFLEQDEEFLLQRIEHFPVLARLAQDRACPKCDIAVAIMDEVLMRRSLRGDREHAREWNETAARLLSVATRPPAVALRNACRERALLLTPRGQVSREQAMRMGSAALLGVSRLADIRIEEEVDAWRVEAVVSSESEVRVQREWLLIDKATGEFIYSR